MADFKGVDLTNKRSGGEITNWLGELLKNRQIVKLSQSLERLSLSGSKT